jgi:probable F420-dependent oxidoreductase
MNPPLLIGLNLSALAPEAAVEGARLAEAAGYESVWVGEHVAIVDQPDWWRTFPAAQGDPQFREDMVPFALRAPWLDPMVMLGALSRATRRVRLGVGIYMLALRHPVLVAKSLVTLDFLSDGRIDFAVGLGWSPDEYAITGNDWRTRGRRTNEALEVLRVLFEEESPEHHGEFFDFPPLSFEPRPRQRPFPVHIGGGGRAAMRRAVAYGRGWYGSPEAIPELRALLMASGRRDEDFQFSTITTGGPLTHETLKDFASRGVHRAVVTPWAGVKSGTVGLDRLDEIELYARKIGLLPGRDS